MFATPFSLPSPRPSRSFPPRNDSLIYPISVSLVKKQVSVVLTLSIAHSPTLLSFVVRLHCSVVVNGSILRLRSELFGRDLRAFRHRLELCSNHSGMNLWVESGLRRESAVASADHILAPDELGVPADSFRDQFGVFDDVTAVGDHSGDKDLSRRKLDVFPQAPLVLMARIRRFERNSFGIHFQQEADNVFQPNVEDARTFVDAVAGVIADLLRGNAAQRVVQSLDVNLSVSHTFGNA